MEVVTLPNGKFEVYLNGSILSCISDIDCPGAALCAKKQKWQVRPDEGMCMCNSGYGFTGATCEEFCEEAIATIAVDVTAGTASLCLAILSGVMLWRLHHTRIRPICNRFFGCCPEEPPSKQSSTRSSQLEPSPIPPPVPVNKKASSPTVVDAVLVCCFVGMMLHMVGSILNCIFYAGFAAVYTVVIPLPQRLLRVGWKRPPQSLDYAYGTIDALAMCISVSAVFLLPLTWVNFYTSKGFIHQATNIAVSAVGNLIQINALRVGIVMRRKKAIFTVYFIFLASAIIVEITFYMLYAKNYRAPRFDDWFLAIIIGWCVILGTVCILNGMALVRIYLTLRRIPQEACAVRKVLRRLEIAALLILLCCLAAFLAMGIALAVSTPRGFYADPRCYLEPRYSMFRAARLILVLLVAVTLYSVLGSGPFGKLIPACTRPVLACVAK